MMLQAWSYQWRRGKNLGFRGGCREVACDHNLGFRV
jgi:hypothetical protein